MGDPGLFPRRPDPDLSKQRVSPICFYRLAYYEFCSNFDLKGPWEVSGSNILVKTNLTCGSDCQEPHLVMFFKEAESTVSLSNLLLNVTTCTWKVFLACNRNFPCCYWEQSVLQKGAVIPVYHSHSANTEVQGHLESYLFHYYCRDLVLY